MPSSLSRLSRSARDSIASVLAYLSCKHHSRPSEELRAMQVDLSHANGKAAGFKFVSNAVQGEVDNTYFPFRFNSNQPLFAVVIGIDKYRRNRLKGCVADANAIKDYLINDLRVPSSQINCILDENATRANIISALRALRNDDRVHMGDAILIYYAGHGGEMDAPEGWETGGQKVQMLIPQDHYVLASDAKGEPGILDRTLGAILSDIANVKGDNITVILDCCHSGSGARTDDVDPTRLVRGVEITGSIPANLDHDIWEAQEQGRAAYTPAGFIHNGLRSHVLLAACHQEEKAQEIQMRGVFTTELLKTLEKVGVDKVTYADLLKRMSALPQQNPQCEGVNQSRILFNNKIAGRETTLYDVVMEGEKYVIKAGLASGITVDTEFTIYRDVDAARQKESPLGQVIVTEVNDFTAQLDVLHGQPRFSIDTASKAVRTKASMQEDLRIYVTDDNLELRQLLDPKVTSRDLTGLGPMQRAIFLAPQNQAHLGMSREVSLVVFDILDPLVTRHGLTRLAFPVSPDTDSVYRVLYAAAHYHWHLNRKRPKPTKIGKELLRDKVHIKFTRLEQVEDEYDEELKAIFRPVGPELNKSGVVDILVDENALYGLNIENKSPLPLYPYLYYFDNSDLSITPYFEPPTTVNGSKVYPPLNPSGSLSIGYGAGGVPPFNYYLREGQAVDVGFLKLFITTEPMDDASDIPQESPFGETRAGQHFSQKIPSTWDTILISVVQRQKSLDST